MGAFLRALALALALDAAGCKASPAPVPVEEVAASPASFAARPIVVKGTVAARSLVLAPGVTSFRIEGGGKSLRVRCETVVPDTLLEGHADGNEGTFEGTLVLDGEGWKLHATKVTLRFGGKRP